MNVDLLNIINNIIFKKQISWQFGIENARIVTKYAVGCDSVSEMIFSGDYNFTGVLVPTFDFDFSETTFLEKLKIKHWSYSDFVLSAILFCIQYELTRGTPSFFILSKNIVYLLFNETLLGEEVFNVLKSTNFFSFYRRNALSGINSFFQEMTNLIDLPQGYYWNTLGVFRILSLFFLPPSFIDKCIADCIKQNTLGPFMLTLYALKTNLDLSIATQNESFAIINNFKRFKASLIKKKYLSNRFFFDLFFEKKYIKDFYGSNIKVKLKQAGTGAIVTILASILVTSVQLNFIPNPISFHRNVPQLVPNTSKVKKKEVQTNSSILPEPIKFYNRLPITVYSHSLSTNVDDDNLSKPMGSILAASRNNIEITTHSVFVSKRKRTYEYLIVKVDGIYQFCPYGIYGQYNNLKYDLKHHIIPDAKRVFTELKAPFIYLGNQKEYELDHVLKQCFRDAFNISEEKAHVVVVPPRINAERTNKVPKYEYSLFDIRVTPPWIANKMPSLFKLIRDRLWDSMLWTRNAVLLEFVDLDDSLVKVILDKIENGYNHAMTFELVFVQDFINNLPAGRKSINHDSCLAFLQEMLLQGRVNDLQKMKD